jgi:hypothetical protein
MEAVAKKLTDTLGTPAPHDLVRAHLLISTIQTSVRTSRVPRSRTGCVSATCYGHWLSAIADLVAPGVFRRVRTDPVVCDSTHIARSELKAVKIVRHEPNCWQDRLADRIVRTARWGTDVATRYVHHSPEEIAVRLSLRDIRRLLMHQSPGSGTARGPQVVGAGNARAPAHHD